MQGILARRPEIRLAVSATTRPARPMEKEGHHYYFISERDFLSMRDRGEFLEWAEVHGNLYGTPRPQVEDYLKAGRDVILEIDVQGAALVKSQVPEAGLIFIEAPSMQVLEQRLRNRRTENDDLVTRRMSAAYDELGRNRASMEWSLMKMSIKRSMKCYF